ncbi:MAG: dipeptide epimerase [Gammaproteobacteria bacterium]|nr:dipeptide epimerase [Gammaproteobacteria bacterium]
MDIVLESQAESWDLAAPFSISRGTKSRADVVVVTARDGEFEGRGEGVPYARYGESVSGALQAIAAFRANCRDCSRDAVQRAMPPGAARNAVDCALWDLEARRRGVPAWKLAGLPAPVALETAYTIVLDDVAAMAAAARGHASRPLLKLKLGGAPAEDVERLRVVRDAAPGARLIVDANEGWSMAGLERVLPVAAEAGVELIEQPLPADGDDALAGFPSPVPLGADESVRAAPDLAELAGKYQVLNIKLDKTGGLTAALGLVRNARAMGFDVMIGCMVATSLSMAPALLLARDAAFVDLDGPLLLAADRPDGLRYEDGRVAFPPHGGWGQP